MSSSSDTNNWKMKDCSTTSDQVICNEINFNESSTIHALCLVQIGLMIRAAFHCMTHNVTTTSNANSTEPHCAAIRNYSSNQMNNTNQHEMSSSKKCLLRRSCESQLLTCYILHVSAKM